MASQAWAAVSYYQGPTVAGTDFETDRIARGLILGSIVNFSGQSLGATLANVGGTGVSFSVNPGFIDVQDNAASYNAVNSGDAIAINLPADVYMIGLYLSRLAEVSPSTVTYAGGSFALPQTGTVFFGVISETPLSSIPTILLSPSNGLKIHSFFIGTQGTVNPPIDGEVPEPATAALLSGSLIALAVMARRRKQAQAPRPTAEP